MSAFQTFMVVTLAICAALPGESQVWQGVLPGGSQGWVGGLGNQVLPGGSLGWRRGLGNPGVFPGGYQGWQGGVGNLGVLPGSQGWVGGPEYPGVLPGNQGWVGGAGNIAQHRECAALLISGSTPRVDLPPHCTQYLYPRNKVIHPGIVG